MLEQPACVALAERELPLGLHAVADVVDGHQHPVPTGLVPGQHHAVHDDVEGRPSGV